MKIDDNDQRIVTIRKVLKKDGVLVEATISDSLFDSLSANELTQVQNIALSIREKCAIAKHKRFKT